jgi:hypothetical protein
MNGMVSMQPRHTEVDRVLTGAEGSGHEALRLLLQRQDRLTQIKGMW